jgi:hypothetical protein
MLSVSTDSGAQNMNWEAIGAIGEVVGAIAVVATLGYLAVQTRHARDATEANTKALKSAARIEAARYWTDEVLRLALSPDMAIILAQGFEDASVLDASQRERLIAWYVQRMAATDALYSQYQDGSLPAEAWRPHEKVLVGFLQYDSFVRVWNAGYIPTSDGFREHVDDLVENRPAAEWAYSEKGKIFD